MLTFCYLYPLFVTNEICGSSFPPPPHLPPFSLPPPSLASACSHNVISRCRLVLHSVQLLPFTNAVCQQNAENGSILIINIDLRQVFVR